MRCLLVVFLLTLAPALAAQDRPDDGLLTRPDLQALVEAQNERAAAPLLEALRADDPAVRARAAFALASVQDSAAVPALVEALRDSIAAVRADAAFALGQTPGGAADEALLAVAADDTSRIVRALVLEALGKRGDQATLDAVAALDVPHALHAAHSMALARFGLRGLTSDDAFALLATRLASDDPAVREASAYGFARVRDAGAYAAQVPALRDALAAYGADDPAAQHLLLALGRLERKADVPLLVRWLEDDDARWQNRANAARALAPFADEEAAQVALFDALTNPIHHVRVVAAQTLTSATTWSETLAEAVQNWVEARTPDEEARVQGLLLAGLAQHGHDPQAVLHAVAERAMLDLRTYRYALPALAYLPDSLTADGATPFALLHDAAMSRHARIAAAALGALATRYHRADDPGLDAYLEVFGGAVRRRDVATVYTAAPLLADSALAAHGGVDVLLEVYPTLMPPADVESQQAILGALGRAGDERAVPVLQDALASPIAAVQRAAADALAQLTGTRPAFDPAGEAPGLTLDWDYLADLGPAPELVLETERGTIVVEMDASQAPLTAYALARFAEDERYDGVPFHRVVPNFVAQGGDFVRRDGFGGPSFFLQSAFTRIPYERGAAGMASAGKDTEGSQFFFTHSPQPHLDGHYTAFGRITEGLDVLDALHEDDLIEEAYVR